MVMEVCGSLDVTNSYLCVRVSCVYVQPLDPADDNFQHLTATKEFTLQNLMPYLNDLADVGCQIAGWLGMEHKFSVIRIMPGVAASPRDQLQVLLTKWLEDSEQPNAPHDWEFFIRVVRGVNKGRLAERIKKEVFKGSYSVHEFSFIRKLFCQHLFCVYILPYYDR